MTPTPRRPALALVCCLAVAIVLSACRTDAPDDGVVARLGDEVLTDAEIAEALATLPQGLDAEMARAQVVEQWVTNQLLAQEARRRGLHDDPDVQRQLKENERSVLAAAMLGRLYDEESAAFNPAELESYFARNRDRMRLREPYVRVRFVETRTERDAQRAHDALRGLYTGSLDPAARDSAFAVIARRFAVDSTAALALSETYVPQSRLSRQTPGAPWSVIGQLSDHETSGVMPGSDSTFFVVQLVERAPAGAEPRIEWVVDEVQRRLAIQNRKQMVAREVQRLRTEAMARGDLRVAGADFDL